MVDSGSDSGVRLAGFEEPGDSDVKILPAGDPWPLPGPKYYVYMCAMAGLSRDEQELVRSIPDKGRGNWSDARRAASPGTID